VMNWFYVRARYYLANVGRWLTVDPLWPGQKSYGYVNSSPNRAVDPSGLNAMPPPPISCDSFSNDLVLRVCFACKQNPTPVCVHHCNSLASEYYYQCCLKGKKPGPCRRGAGNWFPLEGVGVIPPGGLLIPYPPPQQGSTIAPSCSYLTAPCENCIPNSNRSNGSVSYFDLSGCLSCCSNCSGNKAGCNDACTNYAMFTGVEYINAIGGIFQGRQVHDAWPEVVQPRRLF